MGFAFENKSIYWILVLSTVFYLVFHLFIPFNKNIEAILILFGIQFVLYGYLVFELRSQASQKFRISNEFWLVVAGAILFRLILLFTPSTLSDDIYRYIWDGRLQLAGLNPYTYPPAAEELIPFRDSLHPLINHPTIRTIYPPISQWIFKLGAFIAPVPLTQKSIFILFDFGIIAALVALCRSVNKNPIIVVLYAFNPLVIVEFASSGHNDSAMLFFWLGAITLFLNNKKTLSGVFYGAAVLTKFIPLVMIPYWVVKREWKLLSAFTMAVFFMSMPFLVDFLPVNISSVKGLTGIQSFSKDWVFNSGFYQMVTSVWPNPTQVKILFGLILVGISFLLAAQFRDRIFHYSLYVTFSLLFFSPVVHPWYLTWIIPFLCFAFTLSGLVWTALVFLSYIVLIPFVQKGIWALPTEVLIFEYGCLYALLIGQFLLFFNQRRMISMKIKNAPSTPLSSLRVGIIIPALNEEASLPLVIRDIPRAYVEQIIVVDNGSTDETAAKALEAGAEVVKQPIKGYGLAVQTGIKNLNKDINTIVVMDGDRSDFPEDLPSLLEPIKNNKSDFVMGNRTEKALSGSLMPQQRFGNWLTCSLIKLLYGHAYRDMGPFRAIRRDVLTSMKMEDRNFGWNVEMQVKALRNGYRVEEVSVRYRPRIGFSKISGTVKGSIKAGAVILRSVIRYGIN